MMIVKVILGRLKKIYVVPEIRDIVEEIHILMLNNWWGRL
jgi:hypothetical protein